MKTIRMIAIAASLCVLAAACKTTGKAGAFGPTTGSDVTISASLSVDKGNLSDSMSVQALSIGMTGQSVQKTAPLIGTNTWTQLPVGSDITAGGYAMFKNVSTQTTDYIVVGPSNGVAFCVLDAGQSAGPIRLFTTNVWAKTISTTSTNASGGFDTTGAYLQNFILSK